MCTSRVARSEALLRLKAKKSRSTRNFSLETQTARNAFFRLTCIQFSLPTRFFFVWSYDNATYVQNGPGIWDMAPS